MAISPSIKIETSMITDFSTPVSDESNKNKYLKVNNNGKIEYKSSTEVYAEIGGSGLDADIGVINERIDEEVETLNNTISSLTSKVDNDINGVRNIIDSVSNDFATNMEELTERISNDEQNLQTAITELTSKIDTDISDLKSYVDTQDTNYFNTLSETIAIKEQSLNDAISLKADKTYVDEELDKKADKATTIAGYNISDAYTKTEVDAKVSSVYRYRGTTPSYDQLPTTDLVIGDVWNVDDSGSNYVWDGTSWDKLSETIDLTPYLLKEDASKIYATIDSLGNNDSSIKTITEDIADLRATKADKSNTYTKDEVNDISSSTFKYIDDVQSFNDLPTDVSTIGYVYKVNDTDAKYFWNGSEWDELSGGIDLTPYLLKDDAETTYAKITYVDDGLSIKADIEDVPVINKVTVEEYNEMYLAGTLKEDEYYLTPDGSETIQYYRPPLLLMHYDNRLYNDISWLRSNPFSWHNGNVYKAVYNKLVDGYNDESSIEQIEDGVTYKLTKNGEKIAEVSQQNTISNLYDNTGIAMYYIIDIDNTQFKLPRERKLDSKNAELNQYFYVGYYDQELNKQEALIDLMSTVNSKANKSTTLGGYGIANAYTKNEVDALLNNKANSSTTIAGYNISDAYTKAEVDGLLSSSGTFDSINSESGCFTDESGLILQWGSANGNITFTKAYTIGCQVIVSNMTAYNVTNTGFTIDIVTEPVRWFAIGK